MSKEPNRRPLASRNTSWAAEAARRVAATGITPNQISMLGMVFAAIAGVAFWGAGASGGAGRVLLLMLGAVFTQGRLLCNLLDGMVAIEAGKQSPDGKFWNEFPDRVADALILVGLGLGAGLAAFGWAVTAFAFLTAYIRELGVNCGLSANFSGPMAKPHRMAAVTMTAVLAMFAPLLGGYVALIRLALWIILIGTALTALRRAFDLVSQLRRRG